MSFGMIPSFCLWHEISLFTLGCKQRDYNGRELDLGWGMENGQVRFLEVPIFLIELWQIVMIAIVSALLWMREQNGFFGKRIGNKKLNKKIWEQNYRKRSSQNVNSNIKYGFVLKLKLIWEKLPEIQPRNQPHLPDQRSVKEINFGIENPQEFSLEAFPIGQESRKEKRFQWPKLPPSQILVLLVVVTNP